MIMNLVVRSLDRARKDRMMFSISAGKMNGWSDLNDWKLESPGGFFTHIWLLAWADSKAGPI